MYLHRARDALSVTEDLVQVLGTQDVPERGLRKQPRGVVRVLHIGHGDRCVRYSVVDNSVDRHCHGVLCQNLE